LFGQQSVTLWVPVTVHRGQIMKRKNQQDAIIRCLLLTSVSACFGHHYAHLQENKGPVTAFAVLFWVRWMWLVAVVGRCLAGCEHHDG
jgi:glycerol-3-phosphate acyltransferase PlsY